MKSRERFRPWMQERPENLNSGFVVLRGDGGRVLGMFLDMADARAWVARRDGSGVYLAQCLYNGRVALRWRLKSLAGGVQAELIEGDEGGEVR